MLQFLYEIILTIAQDRGEKNVKRYNHRFPLQNRKKNR